MIVDKRNQPKVGRMGARVGRQFLGFGHDTVDFIAEFVEHESHGRGNIQNEDHIDGVGTNRRSVLIHRAIEEGACFGGIGGRSTGGWVIGSITSRPARVRQGLLLPPPRCKP